MKRHSHLWIGTLLLTLALLAGGFCFLWKTGFFQAVSSLDGMRAYMERFAPFSHLVFFLVQLASVILAPIPSNLTALAGGVLFGVWVSFFLTAAAVISGSVLVFTLARILGRSFADRFVSKRLSDRYLEVIRRKRDTFLALVFLFPFFPDDLICILAGLTDIPTFRFFLLVTLTRPWGLLVACALGGSAISIPLWGMVLIGLAGLAIFGVALKFGDKWENALLERFQK
ncbi:TVP38/TMEM64 family protein [Pseudoflavonifractor sp. 524-17]|uniref:TVP38/TMEM64 family protein n=1 Tax=Pseudoflavonifractor sp. 524-17 TaxID=2304577 RepID=UPI00137AB519|nr:VTT domain-containing protein [Pseudoflavonifractor sp. 524-17]NCE65385.1 TVP38/TMEM64 family protein [Pseudoflavonifractor sp. 524-17]